MKINKVTMTGTDDSISPNELFEISEKYPFVEWGILVSRNSQGRNRFPSLDWMNKLHELNTEKLSLSCHLCGAYVREALTGSDKFSDEIGNIWKQFQRVQINTHGIPHAWDSSSVRGMQNWKKEIILQFDGVNRPILDFAIAELMNCSTLFDMSHGAGILPDEWPMPIDGVKCGYAGGLSPENVVGQIKIIESKVGDCELWIDMETQIRSNNDQLFDLKKVVSVLESCVNTGLILS